MLPNDCLISESFLCIVSLLDNCFKNFRLKATYARANIDNIFASPIAPKSI